MATGLVAGFPSGTASDADPSDSYVKQTAPFEDETLEMWFDHSTNKVHMEDHENTGRDTYSVYMAKNETQGAHVILYAPTETKTDLSISYSEFTATDGSGATLQTEFYYEFYVDVQKVATDNILGYTAEDSIIRNGLIPEAVAPVESLNKGKGTFSIQKGMSQALYLKLKTDEETPSGWYSGTFGILNENGEEIKRATAFAYVWNFALPAENHLRTSIYIGYASGSDALYKNQYDYLLENRLQAMNIPGTLNSSNEYLDDPRVSAFRISTKDSYLGYMSQDEISAVYNDLKTRDDFETLESKIYFYTIDEPTSQQQIDYLRQYHPNYTRSTIDEGISESLRVNSGWPNARTLVTFCDNFPYPDGYSKSLALKSDGTYITSYDGSNRFSGISDAVSAAMDYDIAKIWCPQMCFFTPQSALDSAGYCGYNEFACSVKNMNGIVSGFDCSSNASLYFNWDSIYGSFKERFNEYRDTEALKDNDVELWWYAGGKNKSYTYCYHNIENTGLQTVLMGWQAMQEGVTGYLYYGANLYGDEAYSTVATGVFDTEYVKVSTSDGTLLDGKWRCNLGVRDGYGIYGNGVLFYDRSAISALKVKISNGVLGTLRVEEIRDGIEDYEMLRLYREYYGESAMNSFITKISDNVTSYLSMKDFDRSDWDSSMSDEDIFAEVRKQLGNAVEKASGEPEGCAHEWDNGVVTIPATYTEKGVKTYTCALCGETYTEDIPVLEPFVGDVDGDGFITSKDVKLLRKYIAGSVTESDIIEINSDINGDGIISVKDTKALIKLTVS